MQPKFKIDDKVWIVVEDNENKELPCPVCEKGKVIGKNGKKYECPRCYGEGNAHIYKRFYDVKYEPMYVTGYHMQVEKNRSADGGVGVWTTYYLMPKLDANHSVYLDSTGDDRMGEDMLFGTYQEAKERANALTAEISDMWSDVDGEGE